MLKRSLLTGVVGVLGSGFASLLVGRLTSNPPPGRYWLVGLAAFAPAWLISLLALLGQWSEHGPDAPMPPSVILSSSAALLGVIVTDWAARRLESKPACSPLIYWLFGVVAFIPGWAIALWGLL